MEDGSAAIVAPRLARVGFRHGSTRISRHAQPWAPARGCMSDSLLVQHTWATPWSVLPRAVLPMMRCCSASINRNLSLVGCVPLAECMTNCPLYVSAQPCTDILNTYGIACSSRPLQGLMFGESVLVWQCVEGNIISRTRGTMIVAIVQGVVAPRANTSAVVCDTPRYAHQPANLHRPKHHRHRCR